MAIRNIRTLGDEILRKEAKEITEMTPRIQELIDDMFETMYEANGSWTCSSTGRNKKEISSN